MAEGGGLLNRYRALKLYRGFESLSLRQILIFSNVVVARVMVLKRAAGLDLDSKSRPNLPTMHTLRCQ